MTLAAELLDSPAMILRQLLVDLGVVGDWNAASTAWPARSYKEADAPDNTVTVYDTQGVEQGRSQLTGDTYEFYGCQVRIRAVDPPTGWPKARAIYRALDRASRRTVTVSAGNGTNAYCVHSVMRQGGILSLGKEYPQTERNLWTINVLLDIGLDD